jgi:hypothetical protein
MVKTQIIQNKAMEAMVLSKPARAITRRHKEGSSLMIEIWILYQLDHIACGQNARITLFA